jgi:hypothetical protein
LFGACFLFFVIFCGLTARGYYLLGTKTDGMSKQLQVGFLCLPLSFKRCYNGAREVNMKLSREEVLHIAALARVGMTEDDILKFQCQLSNILENFKTGGYRRHPADGTAQCPMQRFESGYRLSLPVARAGVGERPPPGR